MDECLLDRSPYPIESECGREWNERGPSLKESPVRALVRLMFLLSAGRPSARTNPQAFPSLTAGPGGGLAWRF